MSKPVKYKIQIDGFSILKPDPIFYGGRFYEIEIDVVLMEDIENNPVQIGAIYQLNKKGIWSPTIKNPLGELVFHVFNSETPDNFDLKGSVRNDMEQMAYELFHSTAQATNNYLFAHFEELDKEEYESELGRVASQLIQAKNDEKIRDILISDLLFDAMKYNVDDWPI